MNNDPQRASLLVTYACAFIVAVWIAHILLRRGYEPGHPVRLMVTALLIAGFALLVAAEVRLIHRLDEFQRHVQLLALAIAFGCSLVAVMGVGFFRAEGFFQKADPRDLPGLMMLSYLVGLVIAWKRYQ